VRAEIVHDDDVAGLENGNEYLVDIELETLAVDRSIDEPWCLDAVVVQRREAGAAGAFAIVRSLTGSLRRMVWDRNFIAGCRKACGSFVLREIHPENATARRTPGNHAAQ